MKITVGFTGSRSFPAPILVEDHVKALARKYPDATVVSGGRGVVDTTAEHAALMCGLGVISYVPQDGLIEVLGSFNGKLHKISEIATGEPFIPNCFARNSYIAAAHRVVGFWDLSSRGTADTLSKAKGLDRPRFVWDPTGRLLTREELDVAVHRVLG